MELTIKGKTFHIWNKKRILYTICFFLLCLIDQRTKTGSGLDGAIEVFRNLTGVVMALIIFSHYKWKEIAAGDQLYQFRAGIALCHGFYEDEDHSPGDG
jgi:hypothetical protein